MIYLQIFWAFFNTGLFAIGGGLATLPFMYDMVARFGWFAPERIADLLAVAQLLPGAIGINLGAYVASFAAPAGSFVAPLGMITPQIVIILIVSKVLNVYKTSPTAQAVFFALKPAACGLLAAAGFLLCKTALINTQATTLAGFFLPREWGIFALILAGIFIFKKHPALYIGIAALAGIALQL